MIAGLGGLYYVMDYACGVWSNDAFGDRGWLAIALVIFTIWRPNISVFASFLFGGLYILYLYLPTGIEHMEYQELYKMIPYVVTLLVLSSPACGARERISPLQVWDWRTSEKKDNNFIERRLKTAFSGNFRRMLFFSAHFGKNSQKL